MHKNSTKKSSFILVDLVEVHFDMLDQNSVKWNTIKFMVEVEKY